MQDDHLSDHDLILAADGELSARRASQIRSHLDFCWSCRSRAAEFEATIGDFVRERGILLNERIPSAAGPRALLRARLAEEMSAMPAHGPLWRLLPVAAALSLVVVAMVIVFGGNVNAEGPKPKTSLTPGETRPVTIGQVCGSAEIQPIGNVSPETQRQVFAAYGMTAAPPNAYEVDYLITPELGGADTIRNLWPQPYSVRWNARVKDQLERRLHQLVCEGKLDLATAQHDISTDWIGAWKKYVGPQ